MSREAFAHIHQLSLDLSDPRWASWVMHNTLCSNLKLTRKVLTENLLTKMMRLGVGTNEVEIYARRMSKQNVRKGRNYKLVRDTMRSKIRDAEYDKRVARRQFVRDIIEYRRVTKKNSFVDVEFRRIMKWEVETVWECAKEKNVRKVDTLMNRWVPKRNDVKNIRDVKYTDEDLSTNTANDNSEEDVIVYGGGELTENMKAALRMNPKYMMYNRIDERQIEVEIEKGLTKARYSWMGEKDKSDKDGGDGKSMNESEEDGRSEVYNMSSKTADYANVKATDLPTVQRLFPPRPASLRRELAMQNMKEKMISKTKEYKSKKCNQKGWLKEKNVNKEFEGLREINVKVKAKQGNGGLYF